MNMNDQLKQYYKSVDIASIDKMRTYSEMFSAFDCEKKDDCRAVCKKKSNPTDFLFSPPIKGDGVYVSQYYQDSQYDGVRIPRIVVLSLSRPQPDPSKDLIHPNNTSQAQSQGSRGGRNEHWPRTLMTVRSLLYPFISNIKNKSCQEIEQLFVHVRTAKCCSNAGGGCQEPARVYANCGVYLYRELSILKPDVIVTQGSPARDAAQNHAFNVANRVTAIKVPSIPSRIVTLKENNQSTYWLPMIFPTETYGHMKTWDKQAGTECNGVRNNLVRYGEKIKKFIDNR